MTYPATTKNNMLNGLVVTHASLHSSFPGTTGANEVSGGAPAYARQSVTLNTASGGIRSISVAAVFNVPACTVRYIGLWDGSTFVGSSPNGGATPKNFMAVPSSDTVYATNHGWADGQKIVFVNGTPPGGITEGATYYVINSAPDSFKVSTSSGGAAVDMTSAPSFGCVVCAITEDEYSAQSTHTLSAAYVVFPD